MIQKLETYRLTQDWCHKISALTAFVIRIRPGFCLGKYHDTADELCLFKRPQEGVDDLISQAQ